MLLKCKGCVTGQSKAETGVKQAAVLELLKCYSRWENGRADVRDSPVWALTMS